VDKRSIYFKSIYGISLLLIVVSFAGYVLRTFEFLKANPKPEIIESEKVASENKDDLNANV
jgi:hypothetical protein